MTITRRKLLQSSSVALLALEVGCGSDPPATPGGGAGPDDAGGSDAGADAESDAGADAESDTGADAESDAGVDAESDAGVDAESDAGADAESDADVEPGTLVWQDDAAVSSGTYTWDEAGAYAADLVLDGHGDWRLPTEAEIATIEEEGGGLLASIEHGEVHWYWTADEVDSARAIVRYHQITAGIIEDKSSRYFVRCVRSA